MPDPVSPLEGTAPAPEYYGFTHCDGLDLILSAQTYQSALTYPRWRSWPKPTPGGASCNVAILGQPGTGKSTLALNMACRMRLFRGEKPQDSDGDRVTVVYCSLEQEPEPLRRRVQDSEGSSVITLEGPRYQQTPQVLKGIVDSEVATWRQARDNSGGVETPRLPNIVFFPDLSPRRLEQTGESRSDDAAIFWERLSEIRRIVERINQAGYPPAMVVIDSLNVFGDQPVSRYLIEQLFKMLAKENVIAMVVAEDPSADGRERPEEPTISPGIAYLADIVIELGWGTDCGYEYRTITVKKSRLTANVYSSQQMKIRKSGIEVFPSLHAWYTFLLGAGSEDEDSRITDPSNRLKFGTRPTAQPRFPKFIPFTNRRPASLTHVIHGPRGTGKREYALRYAAQSSRDFGGHKEDSSFLLVALGTALHSLPPARGVVLKLGDRPDVRFGGTDGKATWLPLAKGYLKKAEIETVEGENANGLVLWLAPGFLLPEEFVQYVFDVLQTNAGVTRVVVDDVAQIPVRYPVIARQIRELGNFYTVLAEMFRKMRVDATFVCSKQPRRDIVETALLSVCDGTFETKSGEGDAEYHGSLPLFRA